MQFKLLAPLIFGICGTTLASATPPSFSANTCPVKVDGTRVGTDLTPGGSSLRNTIAYEPSTRLYHFWGFTADDANYPSAASSLRGIVHAKSTDGLHFTSDSNLTYAFGSADFHTYGASIDPPLDFFRAVFDTRTSTWKLFNWTENVGSSVGSYNYNTSVNDLGTVASTTSVQHQGPLPTLNQGGAGGDHVGAFGLVDDKLYLRIDSRYADDTGGGVSALSYTDGIPPQAPWSQDESAEANLFTGTPYCWGLATSCDPNTDPNAAYVHNVGRTLRQTDGTLGTYYTFRRWDGSRADKQIWYVESSDNGATWSAPAGVFADGNAITINGQPLDATAGTANFSSVELISVAADYRAYFSTQDAAGKYVFVSSLGYGSDTLFANGFEGCGD